MQIAYGELIGGVSGDMFVAALIDLGLPLNKLRSDLEKIPTLRFDLNRTLKERLEAAGCSIPYPQRDVHLYKVD